MERYAVTNDTKNERCSGFYDNLADAQWAVPDLLDAGDEYTIFRETDDPGAVGEAMERGICASYNAIAAARS